MEFEIHSKSISQEGSKLDVNLIMGYTHGKVCVSYAL
jgi:hypothetical protein